ncbi:MAG: hypothetical protein KatS3mg060_3710 [Dehalococcoidia bacterium]|nr:MAG: hypothetical protein KatS3mg060_3710 [Dehalococcoidia bacterium]
MKKEYIVERQGKTFVLYAGLLDEAHNRGLRSIRTELLQAPSDDNGQTAVVHATVELDTGVYSGIGDAAPNNVAAPMRTCLIRMAETRAKARALRDAINVSAVAFEELPPDDDEAAVDDNRPTPIRNRARLEDDTPKATPAQVKAIYLIGRNEHRLSEDQIDERIRSIYGRATTEISKRQASEAIDRLKAGNF